MLALSACSAGGSPSSGSDVVSVDHDGAKVLAKTDYAEVIQVSLPAGESIPSHKGGDRIIYSLDDYSIAFAHSGETKNATFSKGDTHYHPAGEHMIKNTGSSPADFVIFERLSKGALPKNEPAATDDVTPKADVGATETRLATNAAFDVYKVSLQPGGKLAPHVGFGRSIYSLDDYKVDFHADGKVTSRTFKTGQVHFHNPGTHWLENTGSTPADFIVVDYKK